jgi:hypothetical protein
MVPATAPLPARNEVGVTPVEPRCPEPLADGRDTDDFGVNLRARSASLRVDGPTTRSPTPCGRLLLLERVPAVAAGAGQRRGDLGVWCRQDGHAPVDGDTR